LHSRQIQSEILCELLYKACCKFDSVAKATIVVLPIVGREMSASCVVEGLVIPNKSVSSVKRMENCKVIVVGNSLGVNSLKSKEKLVFENAAQLRYFREDEEA
jgi:chaperonin GroEL (HSP60 family)